VDTTKQLYSECKPFLFTVNRRLQKCIDYFYNFYFLESDFQSELEEKYLYELNQLFSCHLISYNQAALGIYEIPKLLLCIDELHFIFFIYILI